MLKKDFVDDGIIISVNTLKTRDIISKVGDFLDSIIYSEATNIKEIERMVERINCLLDTYKTLEDEEFEQEEDVKWFYNYELLEFMQELSPEGFYFGSSEGDGACIGYFKGCKNV